MTLAAHIIEVWQDPERRARYIQAFWLASVGMVALGYALIANHYWGRLPMP